jgi:hypothetical protein
VNDDGIRQLLRELPPATASADFTTRVLARLDRPARRPARPARRLAWTAAAAAAIGLVAFAGLQLDRVWAAARTRAELTALRSETSQLAGELQRLRQSNAATSPVLYLGGDEQIDLVFDLRRAARRGPAPKFQPASYGARTP